MNKGRHIVIVGNGEIAPLAAPVIDAADLVVRFNECGSFGRGGTKTDIVAVCNTGRPAKAMLSSDAWKTSAPVTMASALWSVRDPAKFAAMRAPLAVSHPELDDFCDDYTDAFAAFAAATGKTHEVIGAAVHEATDSALAPYAPGRYVAPSSGLIVVMAFLSGRAAAAPFDTISIAGFSHVGWEGHPFAAERRLVDAWVADGRLTRIAEPDLSSQGA